MSYFTASYEGQEIKVYCETKNGVKYWIEEDSNVVEYCDSAVSPAECTHIQFNTGDNHYDYPTTGYTMVAVSDYWSEFHKFIKRHQADRAPPTCATCKQPIV